MKKATLTTIAIIACLSSCSKVMTDNNSEPIKAEETRSILQEQVIAPALEEAISFDVSEKDIRAFVKRIEKDRKIRKIESIQRENKPVVYVVNYEKGGWTLFSSDKHLPPVLAENPEGTFDVKELDNPGVIEWLDGINKATRSARKDCALTTANESTELWEGKKLSTASKKQTQRANFRWTKMLVGQETDYNTTQNINPLVETQWGQDSLWWDKLPISYGTNHYPTGCVAVALSQVLYYYNHKIGTPSGLYHNINITNWVLHYNYPYYYQSTLSRANMVDPSDRWNNMKLSYKDTLEGRQSSYVSDLMVDVGNRVQMQYYADGSGSGATFQAAYNALSYYDLQATTGNFQENAVDNNLNNERPILIFGTDPVHGGHAWVLDGLLQSTFTTVNTYIWWLGYDEQSGGEGKTQEEAIEAAEAAGYDKPEDGMTTTESVTSGPYKKYHMNWGWNGKFDGYYTEIPYVNGLQFNSNIRIVYNIRKI